MVNELTKSLIAIISSNCAELQFRSYFFEYLQNKKNIPLFEEDYIEIIANNICEFIKDDRLYSCPICVIYNILNTYYRTHKKKTVIVNTTLLIFYSFI
mgnify:CR=1 FL=1